jgi:hypothetical protein
LPLFIWYTKTLFCLLCCCSLCQHHDLQHSKTYYDKQNCTVHPRIAFIDLCPVLFASWTSPSICNNCG